MARKSKKNKVVLADGEVTGHAHVAEAEGVTLTEETPAVKRLSAPKGAKVVHEEHKPVTLPPGDYEVRRVQEYDHFAEEARAVQD